MLLALVDSIIIVLLAFTGCPPLPLDPRLIITYDPDITEDAADYHNVGTTATYECPPSQPPALLEGNPVRTCESNGLWSGVAPVCRFPERKTICTFMLAINLDNTA